MALSADTIWEVRADGNSANGGGWRNGASGVDRTQQASPHATLTTASTVHTTTTQINVDPGDYTVTADDVGNVLQISSGTATAGYYEIISADPGNNRWTLDRSAGASTQTVGGRMGGALALPTQAVSAMVGNNVVWIRAGSYTITAGMTIPAASPNNAVTSIIGYSTTRGDNGRPTITLSGSSITACESSGTGIYISNVIIDGDSQTSSRGVSLTNLDVACERVEVRNCTNGGIRMTNATRSSARRCSAISCTGGDAGIRAALIDACVAKGCTVGFNSASIGSKIVRSLSYDNSSHGISVSESSGVISCISWGNTGDGIRFPAGRAEFVKNCILGDNGGWNINIASGDPVSGGSPFLKSMEQNAFFTSTSGNISFSSSDNGDNIVLTGDPFVNSAADDFNLNDTAGAGAALRAEVFTL